MQYGEGGQSMRARREWRRVSLNGLLWRYLLTSGALVAAIALAWLMLFGVLINMNVVLPANTARRMAGQVVQSLEQADPFFAYQQLTHPQTDQAASHMAVAQAIRRTGRDYRFETAPHPVAELQSREQDNTRVGRDPQIPGYDTMP